MTEPDPISDHDPALGLDLHALRERLRQARAERGACPPWEELRDDLLPGGARRAGREERLAHRELCPYCDAHVREWERSLDRTSDALGAVEKQVARGVVEGARRILTFGAPGPGASPSAPRPPAPSAPSAVPAPPASVAPAPPAPAPRRGAKPAPRRAVAPAPAVPPRPAGPAAAPPAPPASAPALLRLLVVEASSAERIPASVFLCAEALGLDVAHVPWVDDLAGDPDLDAVAGVVFAGARTSEQWPEAVRRARDLAPGRPVVVLVGGGTLAAGGAQKALGGVLLPVDAPAEALLLALDPRL